MNSDGAGALPWGPTEEFATHLLAANEQLVVAALRSETDFRVYFDVSPDYLFIL